MRNSAKCIYYFTIKLFETIVSCFAIMLFSSFKTALNFKKLRLNKRSNGRCNVLGNGPSLDEYLGNNDYFNITQNSIAVNFFCNANQFQTVKPNFYVICDPSVFNDDLENNHLKINILLLIKSMSEVDWKMTLLVPFRFRKSKLFSKFSSNFISVNFYNDTPIKGFKSIMHFFYKNNLGMPISESVIISSIFVAINLNFDIINLFGVDQSWLKDVRVCEKNIVSIGFDHFNGETKRVEIKTTLTEFLLSQARLFSSHQSLNEYAEAFLVKINNLSKYSYIDSYDKETKIQNSN